MKSKLEIISVTVCCAFAGLLVMLVLGMANWTVVRGLNGILLSGVVAGVTGVLLRSFGELRCSYGAAVAAGMLAAYGALATAELVQPGSVEWAVRGGLYGAFWGGLVAVIFSIPKALVATHREPSAAESHA